MKTYAIRHKVHHDLFLYVDEDGTDFWGSLNEADFFYESIPGTMEKIQCGLPNHCEVVEVVFKPVKLKN